MLPFIVITAAIIFFLLQRGGFFENLRRQNGGDPPRRKWGRRIIKELEQDPELNQRLEVFKDFLDGEQDEEQ
jgi:hypothetical protein